MGRGAKNHRFFEQRAVAPQEAGAGSPERRQVRDRRDPSRTHLYAGVERRQGPRRATDLPSGLRDRPLAVALAVVAGVATALTIGSLSSRPRASPSAGELAAAQRGLRPTAPSPAEREALETAQAVRDAAEALTPATVQLDERAAEHWLPIAAELEALRDDPSTPTSLCAEFEATLAALERVGLLQPA